MFDRMSEKKSNRKHQHIEIPKEAMKYFRLTGAMGGRARAKNHTPEELSKWGKMGGRPKGSGKKRGKGGN
jgi:hypothetical protein